MRPQQQNRRMRGRGNNNSNNNRKGPNPLTRSYESNGPDVKIRGTAQQIAEKYATLARDAQSSGDRVMAENYLQHAEHYNRLIAAAQAQLQPQQNMRDSRMDDDSDDMDERDEDEAPIQVNGHANGHHAPQRMAPVDDGSGPQPVIEGMPAEVALNREAGDVAISGRTGPRGGTRRATQAAPRREKAAKAAEAATPQPEAEPEMPVAAAPVAAAPADAVPADVGTAAEEAPKVRRTRRPRAKKVEDEAAEVAASEEAAAQG